ncbi:MAG: TetR/AcrR family transcriptional regulator [Acidobacteriota bacterium]
MRYPPEQKAETRRAILEAAGRVFRRRGYQGGGVDAVMKEAGLTHGGFYAHFRNKEALLGEAVLDAMWAMREEHGRWTEGESGEGWVRAFVDGYVSRGHVAAVEGGCPVPTLVSELGRVKEGPRESFERGLAVWAGDVAEQLEGPETEREAMAMGVIASCVGAIALARAVADETVADRVLAGARELVMAAVKGMTDEASVAGAEEVGDESV